MDKSHRSKLVMALMTLLIVFAIIFALAFINNFNDRALLGLGIAPIIENSIVMCFALLSMVNTIYELKII